MRLNEDPTKQSWHVTKLVAETMPKRRRNPGQRLWAVENERRQASKERRRKEWGKVEEGMSAMK